MSQFPALFEHSTGETHPLDKASFEVGRSSQADLPIFDSACSRKQFRIVRDGDQLCVESLSSSTPTQLNGQPIDGRTPLEHGVEISAGDSTFSFLTHADKITQLNRPDLATMVAPADRSMAGQQTMMADSSSAGAVRELDGPINVEGRMVLGREQGRADVVLNHPHVSRIHAVIVAQGSRVTVADLNSANGTFVNGQRLTEQVQLEPHDRIDVGPFTLAFNGTQLLPRSLANNVQLVCENIGQVVKDRTSGKPLKLLDGVTLVIRPKEFVCVLGPSGSGKSTLMSAMSARVPASEGRVLLNDEELYQHFDVLKQSMAFVPQKDVLHDGLTVEEALRYTARLRLPPDTNEAEIQTSIDEMLETVGLTERRNIQIRYLSGGQIKRASLANEIISKPSLLFLDEVTSGLDEQTDREMMDLFRRIADDGKTVACITHSLANVERTCHLVVILTDGGKLAFVGSPAEALKYFKMDRLGEVYERMQEKSADEWREQFQQSQFYSRYIDSRLPNLDDDKTAHSAPRKRVSWKEQLPIVGRQFQLMLSRYAKIQRADWRAMAGILGQCLLVAGLLVLLFGNIGDKELAVRADHSMRLMFLLAISCVWFGCNNAAKEIVKERSIYTRERDVNLLVPPYYASKLVLLGTVSCMQATLLFIAVRLFCHLPGSFIGEWSILLALSTAGAAMGLLISAVSKTEDMAVTLVPLVLIPQIVLAGLIAPLDGFTKLLGQAAVTSYWAFHGLQAMLPEELSDNLPTNDHSAWFCLLVVSLHGLAFAVATVLVLWLQNSRENLYERALTKLAQGKSHLLSRRS